MKIVNFEKMIMGSVFFLVFLLFVGSAVAPATNVTYNPANNTTVINVELVNNQLSPEYPPIQYDPTTWQPAGPFVYSRTVHGIISEAAFNKTAYSLPPNNTMNLNYTRTNNSWSIDGSNSWTVRVKNGSSIIVKKVNMSIPGSSSQNGYLWPYSKNQTVFPVNYTIWINSTQNTSKYKINLKSNVTRKDLVVPTSTTLANGTRTITVPVYNSSPVQNHTLTIYNNSSLALLLNKSNTTYNTSNSTFSYTCDLTARNYVTSQNETVWYPWIEKLHFTEGNKTNSYQYNCYFNQTGYGWGLFINHSSSPEITAIADPLPSGPANLTLYYCPSSIATSGVPQDYTGQNITIGMGSGYPTAYYIDSAWCSLSIPYTY